MPRRICAPVSTVPAASQPPGGSFRESVMKREQTSCPSLSNQRAALHVNLITDQGQLPPDALHVIHTEISACLPSGGLQLLTGSSSGSLGLGSSLATHCGIYPPRGPNSLAVLCRRVSHGRTAPGEVPGFSSAFSRPSASAAAAEGGAVFPSSGA